MDPAWPTARRITTSTRSWGRPTLATHLGLKNLGLSVYIFERGEGFDFLHNPS